MSFKALKRDFSQLQSDLKGIFRLTRGVPGFFSKAIKLQEAEETIKRELETREARFLELVLT